MGGAEFTGRERAYARARDMSIEGSIRQIVQDDSCTSHHKGSGDEDGDQVKRRHAASRQDQRPQGREHEQPGPGLVLEANEPADGRPGRPRRRWRFRCRRRRLGHAGELSRGVWGCQRPDLQVVEKVALLTCRPRLATSPASPESVTPDSGPRVAHCPMPLNLVFLVRLVCLVYLVCLVRRMKETRQTS